MVAKEVKYELNNMRYKCSTSIRAIDHRCVIEHIWEMQNTTESGQTYTDTEECIYKAQNKCVSCKTGWKLPHAKIPLPFLRDSNVDSPRDQT